VYITRESCQRLVVSMVMSALDYCNALLPGLAQTELKRNVYLQECIAAPAKQVDGIKMVEQTLISKFVSSAAQTRIFE